MENAQLPTTMRAAVKVGSGPLDQTIQVENDVLLPKTATQLPPDHILIKIAYTSLNPIDLKFSSAPIINRIAFPGIPGLDFSGTVSSSSNPDFKPGDKVYGQTQPPNFSACAEYAVVNASHCLPLPSGLSMEEAATIGIAGVMAYQSIAPFVKDVPGAKVFINGGSGGTGTYGIQIAKAMGCEVTTTCSEGNTELCRSLGADEVIDYRAQDVVETLTKKGQQFDLIVDNIFLPGAALYWSCHNYLNPTGTYMCVAIAPSLTLAKDIAATNLWPRVLGGGQRKFMIGARKNRREDLEQVTAWVLDRKVKPVIEKVYPLDEIRDALGRLSSGRTRGKLVLKIE